MYKKVIKFSLKQQKKIWVLVFSFMYLVLVDAMDSLVMKKTFENASKKRWECSFKNDFTPLSKSFKAHFPRIIVLRFIYVPKLKENLWHQFPILSVCNKALERLLGWI